MAATSEEFRDRRRRAKAYAVSRLIWSQLTAAERTDPTLPAHVAAMTQARRDEFAYYVDVPKLSPESWAIVVELIRDRVHDEQHWKGVIGA